MKANQSLKPLESGLIRKKANRPSAGSQTGGSVAVRVIRALRLRL